MYYVKLQYRSNKQLLKIPIQAFEFYFINNLYIILLGIPQLFIKYI